MRRLRVVGFDPSMSNWGIATGIYCLDAEELTITNLGVTSPGLPKGKQVRQNSKDLEAAQQLASGALEVISDAQAIFVEVPHGSQSARAMASYGICVGILGTMRATGTPFFELTPNEVKLAATNNKKATKREMIDWATGKYPNAPWPFYKKNGETLISETKAEHMADAIAVIEAGIQSPLFRQFSLLRA